MLKNIVTKLISVKINGELMFLKLIGMEAKINTIYGYLEMAKTEKDY